MDNDHDLLIELRTEMANVREDIKELKNNAIARISCLEAEKADRTDIEKLQNKLNIDFERRVSILEKGQVVATALSLLYVAIGGTMIGLIFYHMFNQ